VGSSRPAARSLKNLGIACLLAESINGLFYRNAINFALPALEAPGIMALFQEGDVAEIDFEAAKITKPERNEALEAIAMPEQLLGILKAGGIYPLLQSENLIE
ncbi:MAG: 3-isopropylmalate dehydratase, partial [Rhodospirillaceae bacterium]|nr:3-isopropylmalate dehydratase [Rhodospirillaceae bacterium]